MIDQKIIESPSLDDESIIHNDDSTSVHPPRDRKVTKQRAKIIPLPPQNFPRTQLQVAAMVVAKHGADLRWCAEEQAWFVWNGNIWEKGVDEHCAVYRWVREAIIGLIVCAAKIEDDAQRKASLEMVLKWQNHATIVAVMQNIKSDVPAKLTDFDQYPWLMTTQNGTIDLLTGKIRPSRREDYITKEAPTTFDPSARSEKWLDFVAWRCKNSAGFMAYQQRLAGSCLTGDTGDQHFYIDVGDGGNGKSTFWGAIFAALGPYAVPVKADTIMDAQRTNGGAPRSDIMELKGARLALVAEGEDGQRLAEGLVKLLTGGDMITARSPYGRKEIKFWPTHKLIMFTNHAPVIRGSDDGIWRRVHLLPSDASIEKDAAAGIRKKEKLLPIFEKERAAILNWLIDGCLAWRQMGIGTCYEVETATRAYKTEMDLIGNFLLEHLPTKAPSLNLSCKELYSDYSDWCMATGRGRTALPKQRFEADLKKRGASTQRMGKGGNFFWNGLDSILEKLEQEEKLSHAEWGNAAAAEMACPECHATGDGVRLSAPDPDGQHIGFCTHCNHAWKVGK